MEGGGAGTAREESDLGLGVVFFILFLNRFGLHRFNRFKMS